MINSKEYKDNIEGFPGYYISQEGLLYSRYNNRGITTSEYHEMKLYTRSNGYKQVVLKIRKLNKLRRAYVHRLVAEAYIPNPLKLPCVGHKDNDRKNCNVSNLYWGTHKDNMSQASSEGRLKHKPVIRAIIFSDLHLNDWGKFCSRTDTAIEIWRLLANKAFENHVPLIHCGDILHKPENINQNLAHKLSSLLEDLCKIDLVMWSISGNHSIYNVSKIKEAPPSWDKFFSSYNNFWQCIDYRRVHYKNFYIYGVPYVDHNIGLSEYLKNIDTSIGKPRSKHILLLHTDYPGAKDTDGRVIDSAENLNLNVLNRFDLVLCGHIHKPQRLGKKIYMVGAPYQQRRTDKNCKMGYWELYSDLSMKFVPLKGFPKFIDVETEEEVKDDGNYYTVVPKSSRVEVSTKHKITKQLSKKKLAKRYLKEKGIKDKVKENLLIKVLKESESC